MHTLRTRHEYHRRLLRGHPWVWRNDLDPAALAAVTPGDAVRVEASDGTFVGVGLVNPRSHVAIRIVDTRDREPDAALFDSRVAEALSWRDRLHRNREAVRLVYGEADGLPGLVVDRYGPVLVVSQTVLGMDRWTQTILDSLDRRLQPSTIILKNRNRLRELEGLPLETQVVKGDWRGPASIHCDGVQVLVDCLGGRKTGLFLDHADNRLLLRGLLAGGETVLDLFSHCGLWSLVLLAGGAGAARCVDNDPNAIELGRQSGLADGRPADIRFEVAEVGAFLESDRQTYDVVVLDPPAFAKQKRYLKDALAAYDRHNRLALARVRPGGLLATSSCSSFVRRDSFLWVVESAAGAAGRRLQLVAEGHQAPDHPVPLAMPEMGYLKLFVFHVL